MKKRFLTGHLLKRFGSFREPESLLTSRFFDRTTPVAGDKSTGNRSLVVLAVVCLIFFVAVWILSTKVASLKTQNGALLKEYKNLQTRIQTFEEVNKDLTAQIAKAENERTVLKTAMESLTKNNESLNSQVIKSQQTAHSAIVDPPGGDAERQRESNTAIKGEGRVLALNEEHGFVVVDLGKVDGLSSNTTLSVRQNGEEIGTLTVLEIRDIMTACNIKDLKSGKKIAVNDSVFIQK